MSKGLIITDFQLEAALQKQTQNIVYMYCPICKKLKPHLLTWVDSTIMSLPTQFGLRKFTYATLRIVCCACNNIIVKRLKINGKITQIGAVNQQKVIFSNLPLFSKTLASSGEAGEPHGQGEPAEGKEVSFLKFVHDVGENMCGFVIGKRPPKDVLVSRGFKASGATPQPEAPSMRVSVGLMGQFNMRSVATHV